jgi:hypothetical protein
MGAEVKRLSPKGHHGCCDQGLTNNHPDRFIIDIFKAVCAHVRVYLKTCPGHPFGLIHLTHVGIFCTLGSNIKVQHFAFDGVNRIDN